MYFLPNLADFYDISSLLSQKKKKFKLLYKFEIVAFFFFPNISMFISLKLEFEGCKN